MKLCIKDILPKEWSYVEKGNSIKVWYTNFKQNNPEPIKLNKDITISKELGILMGFWAGDGTKNMFVLTNGEITIIKKMYCLLKKIFGLKDMSLRIVIPNNFKNEEKEILRLTKKSFPKVTNIKSKIWNRERNSPIWQLQYTKTVFIKLFKMMYNYVLFNTKKSHEYWDGYLKGIIAAEGHMYLRKKYKTLSKISIAQTSSYFRKSIIRALNARRIQYFSDKKYIQISGKNNFTVILERKLFNLHPEKTKQFLSGYGCIKQNQYPSNKITNLILNELTVPKRISIIAKNLNRCRQTIREHILLKKNGLYKQDLIKRYGKERGTRGAFYGDLWGLTEKGTELIKNEKY